MDRRVGLLAAFTLLAACGTAPAAPGEEGAPGTVIGGDGGTSGSGNLDGGTGGSDGGPTDAGPDADPAPDAGTDSGDDAVISLDVGGDDAERADTAADADPGPDAITEPDTAQPCVPGTATCDGGLLLLCSEASTLVRRRCDPGTACVERDDGRASCEPTEVPDVCEPLEARCSAGGRGIEQCSEDGDGWIPVQECPFGCDAADVECLDEDDVIVPGSCDDDSVPILDAGEFEVDLCEYDDTTGIVPGGACGSEESGEGGDFTFGFTLERRASVTIEAWDADPNAPIDTILALRTSCTEEDSQFACHDDLRCEDSTIFPPDTCSGSVQVRHSRIVVELDPGTYYSVVDHFDYRSGAGTFSCGVVNVRLAISGL